LAACLDAQHAKARFVVVVGHPLNQASERLDRRRVGGRRWGGG
jgi:hypothetical protein